MVVGYSLLCASEMDGLSEYQEETLKIFTLEMCR